MSALAGGAGFRVDRVASLEVTGESFAPHHALAVAEDLARWETVSLGSKR